MAKSEDEVVRLAADLIADHGRELRKGDRLGKIARYLRGEHDLPYSPRNAKKEYRDLARKSLTNWLPLISDTFAKRLWVDGYRPAKASGNAKAWDYWQANKLDARQAIAHRGALEYGASYVLVLPGKPTPVIEPLPPLRTRAMFEGDDDDFPAIVLIVRGKTLGGDTLYELIDDVAVYSLRVIKDAERPVVDSIEEHGLGVCPVVRFRDRLDGEARGIIAPLFNLQDRINEAVFALMIALQFASFRQRWATGLAIPEGEDGKPVEPFQAAVDRLWVTDSENAKFGDFAQTEVSGHLSAYESAVKTLAAIAQTSPHVLLGDLVNLSAEALAAVNDSTYAKGAEYETIFGEAWEQVFLLAARAAGDPVGDDEKAAQVRWRDTEARSLAQTVDALGKITATLMVPAEALWSRIPGVTDTDIKEWKELAGRADGMAALAAALTKHTTPTAQATEQAPAPGAAVAAPAA